MASVQKLMFRGAAATSSNTLYTVPADTESVVTNIIITNSSSSDQTFTLTLDGFLLASTTTIPRNSIVSFDVKQVLATGDLITGFASSTAVIFHISGVEIS